MEWTPSNVHAVRKAYRLSQGSFAEKLAVSSKTVGSWERGTQEPRPNSQVALDDLWEAATPAQRERFRRALEVHESSRSDESTRSASGLPHRWAPGAQAAVDLSVALRDGSQPALAGPPAATAVGSSSASFLMRLAARADDLSDEPEAGRRIDESDVRRVETVRAELQQPELRVHGQPAGQEAPARTLPVATPAEVVTEVVELDTEKLRGLGEQPPSLTRRDAAEHFAAHLDVQAAEGRARAATLGDRPARADRLCQKAVGLLHANTEPDLVTALALLRRAQQLDPQLPEVHAWLAYGLWRRYFAGWDAASATLTTALHHAASALELDDHCEAARMAMVRIYWDLGLHERAVAEGVTALHDRPSSVQATLTIARALNNAGLADLALPMTLRILDADPASTPARKLLVWNHLMAGDPQRAIATARDFWPSGELDSNTAWAVTTALWRDGDRAGAVATAEAALARDDVNFTLWLLLGYVHRASRDEPTAQEVWRQGLEVLHRRQPPRHTNHRAAAWIANLAAARGDHDRAAGMFSSIRQAEPTNGYVAYRLAHVAGELGETGQALTLLKRAVEAGFLSVQLLLHEQACGLGTLVNSPDYELVLADLHQRVDDVRAKYLPLLLG